jgi:cysteine desulfurase
VKSRCYFDYNATAPLRSAAHAAMLVAMDLSGNPSSIHAEGRAAKALVERARAQVAEAVGCKVSEVIFTSGATEAASVLDRLPDGVDVFVQDTAHDALLSHMNLSNWQAPPDGPGHVLAMGYANSETGIVTPPPEKVDGHWPYGAQARADWLLLDLSQTIGRVPFSFAWSGADLAILSAHKLGGPKGVGALIVREGLDIAPLATGGGQEMGRRSGTENTIGIAGFGAAVAAASRDLADGAWNRIEKLRNILETTLEASAKETIFVGKAKTRLPNTSCVLTPGWKGETQVMQMDLAGFAISAGSACSSGKVKSSAVLRAMGFSEAEAGSAIRVSLGPETTESQVMQFCDAWLAQHTKFRARAA